jgi:hypothetical protein
LAYRGTRKKVLYAKVSGVLRGLPRWSVKSQQHFLRAGAVNFVASELATHAMIFADLRAFGLDNFATLVLDFGVFY